MRILTDKQRNFLEYLRDSHGCIGYNVTIPTILSEGNYQKSEADSIVRDWIHFINGRYNDMTWYPDQYVPKEITKYKLG